MDNVPLLLLHGALASQHQFDALVPYLNDHFEIHRLNFEGHGSSDDAGRPFRIENFAKNVLAYLNKEDIPLFNVFGFSLGGYVGFYLAKKYPDKVNRLSTLGTIVDWNEEKAHIETAYLHPEKMEEKIPHFVKQLQNKHHVNWRELVNKTRNLLEDLGRAPSITDADWRVITTPVRLHVGDRDNTAGIEPTLRVYQRLDHSELAILPRTPHPFEHVNTQWLAGSLMEFFTNES